MPENTALSPLAIVGDEDLVLGFGALGFTLYPLADHREFKTLCPEIVKKGTAVCLVQENIYQAQKEQIDSYKNLALPVFIPFSKELKTELLDNLIKGIRLRATGVL